MKRAADDAIDSGVDNRPLPISAIVLTYNEEQNIEACLRSLEGVVDEILVVDSGSTDRTLEIARRFTHNIFTHPFEDYARQRNWCQAALPIRNAWIFHIDADERVTPELVLALRSFFGTPPPATVSGLAVRRRIEFMGRAIVHGGIYPTYHSRIYRLESGRCEAREYDQQFLVDGTLVMLDADLIEHTAQSLFTWTARHNRWAQMEAKHLLAHSESLPAGETIQPKLNGSPIQRRRFLRASVYERSPLFLRALLYFLVRYFLLAGFLDGAPGLIYHVLHAFWFRFYVDACYYEARTQAGQAGAQRASSRQMHTAKHR